MQTINNRSELINENQSSSKLTRLDVQRGSERVGYQPAHAGGLGTGAEPTARLGFGEAPRNPRADRRKYEIEVFAAKTHELSANLRVVVMTDGSPWFVAADVLKALDVSNSVLRRVCQQEERAQLYFPDPDWRGKWKVVDLLSESGLYALLGMFTLCGRDMDKPNPAPLRKWIANAVLPYLHRRYSKLESEIVPEDAEGCVTVEADEEAALA